MRIPGNQHRRRLSKGRSAKAATISTSTRFLSREPVFAIAPSPARAVSMLKQELFTGHQTPIEVFDRDPAGIRRNLGKSSENFCPFFFARITVERREVRLFDDLLVR